MATFGTPGGDFAVDEAGQRQMERYMSKLSGPLVDRIDIHVEVPRVPYHQLAGTADGTDSKTLRQWVVEARRIQAERNGGPLRTNSTLNGRELDQHAALDDAGKELLRSAMTELGLSARAYDKVRRVARTIADLDGRENVSADAVGEAIQYRLLDRKA